jgi:prepilin signal peptidase PulO-like enzyme (type II secretory pathway)
MLLIVFILGLGMGFAINYLADVLPQTRRLSNPRCPDCQWKFSLIEYLSQKKCPQCSRKVPLRNFLSFILSIAASFIFYYFPLGTLNYFLTIPLVLFLGAILVIDIEHRVVLIETCIVGVILCFFYGWYFNGVKMTLLGGIAGFLILLSLYYFGVYFMKVLTSIRKTQSDEVALGFGDVYVAGFLGLLVGWPFAIGMIIMGILGGGIYSMLFALIQIIRKKFQFFSAFPYAPFLILGAILTFYRIFN